MKYSLILCVSLVSSGSLAGGASFSITQNNDTSTITASNSVACPPDDDRYFRRFDLGGAHDLAAILEISSIDFAVEQADSMTLTVNLYAIGNTDDFVLTNLFTIGTAELSVSNVDDLSPVNIPITGTLDGGINDLVVEVFAPDSTTGGAFFIGSNANGQSAPSFLVSAGCGLTEPTDIATINFPDMHMIMAVNGDDVAPTELIFTDSFDLMML